MTNISYSGRRFVRRFQTSQSVRLAILESNTFEHVKWTDVCATVRRRETEKENTNSR